MKTSSAIKGVNLPGKYSQMIILYEKGLSAEAAFVGKVISKVFGIESSLQAEKCNKYFKYNRKVDGFEPRFFKTQSRQIILTNRDLYIEGASSKEDDYLFGCASDEGLFWIACCRLKSKEDKPTKKIAVSKTKYFQRLRYLIVHELGHQLVKNQKHYQEYTIVNPKTGHKTPTGTHCLNKKCVMAQVEDLKMMDQRIRTLNKQLFCRRCQAA